MDMTMDMTMDFFDIYSDLVSAKKILGLYITSGSEEGGADVANAVKVLIDKAVKNIGKMEKALNKA